MAFTASGDGHGYSREVPREARDGNGRRVRGRLRRRLSLLSFGLTAVAFAGIAAMTFLDVQPADIAPARNGHAIEPYTAPATPAIDALGERLAQKPDIWNVVADAAPLFRMRSLELVDLPASYEVREHGRGGRLDLMSFGDFDQPGLHLHMVVYRMGAEAPPPSTLFVDLARRAAETGVGVAGIGTPVVHETKFGTAEIAGVALSQSGRERLCQAFRLDISAQAPYQMLGWTCDDVPVSAPEIACFIDHMALVDNASDPRLAALFDTAAKRQRPECGGVPIPVPPKDDA